VAGYKIIDGECNMEKNYWELKPEELNSKELKKYILDWYTNQVENWFWGNIVDDDFENVKLKSMRSDVAQLNYALTLLDSKFGATDNLDD
jgi:hypothetical protein